MKNGQEKESSLDRLMSASVVRIFPLRSRPRQGGISVRKDGQMNEEQGAFLTLGPNCLSRGGKLGFVLS